MNTFLHVGCGTKYKNQTTTGFNSPEWTELRFDIDQSVSPDIVGTMLDMSAVTSSSVDAIYSSHNIEHLYPYQVPLALNEFLRVLKPDGFLVLTCPDLQSVCALIAENKLTEEAYNAPCGPIAPLDILYGYRPSLAQGNHYMAHKCGFTLNVLIGTLKEFGFAVVAGKARGRKPYFDLWVVASKSTMTEEAIISIANQHFPVD
jgi:SAM-dependent methyltransferase